MLQVAYTVSEGREHSLDLRNARLSLCTGASARIAQALREPVWISTRTESEKDGQIVDNIVNQLLQPTGFSSLK